jgi:hypothetical protein
VVVEQISYWGILKHSGQDVIVLVVDDSDDDVLIHLQASENAVPSPRFGGIWLAGQEDGHWTVVFRLIELGAGPLGIDRRWSTAYFDEELLSAILFVPHLVAILSEELADNARTLDAILPRLQAALYVEVEHQSPSIATVLAERRA